MSLLSRVKSWFASSPARPSPTEFRAAFEANLRAKYEAAQTTDENERYWANADYLSAAAAGNPLVRKTLRSRARYEIANNSYATGMLETLSHDVVGQGPKLQIGSENLEQDWSDWCKRVSLAAKLRTAVKCKKGTDGESFLMLTTNDKLMTPAKLDVRAYEADQISTPDLLWRPEERAVDGVEYDRFRNPTFYHLLDSHPGAENTVAFGGSYSRIRASRMIHWFREDRPNQSRGIPEITPALSLFAQLRRYTMATIAAAETAADFAAVMYTDQPVDPGSMSEADWFTSIPIEYRAMLTLPDGWKMGQLRAEQPTTTYVEFKRSIVSEMARCWVMPRNIAAGDSADYTFASGQLDHLQYWQAIDIERSHLATVVLDVIFDRWLRMHLSEVSGVAPSDIDLREYRHQWIWPARLSRDPLKDAQARKTLFSVGLEIPDDYWLETGRDPEHQRRKMEEYIVWAEETGAPIPGVAVTNRVNDNGEQDEQEDREDSNQEA